MAEDIPTNLLPGTCHLCLLSEGFPSSLFNLWPTVFCSSFKVLAASDTCSCTLQALFLAGFIESPLLPSFPYLSLPWWLQRRWFQLSPSLRQHRISLFTQILSLHFFSKIPSLVLVLTYQHQSSVAQSKLLLSQALSIFFHCPPLINIPTNVSESWPSLTVLQTKP